MARVLLVKSGFHLPVARPSRAMLLQDGVSTGKALGSKETRVQAETLELGSHGLVPAEGSSARLRTLQAAPQSWALLLGLGLLGVNNRKYYRFLS